MEFCSLASGSSGNCLYLAGERSAVLIDVGISGKRIEAGLRVLDRTGTDLNAILLTHEHSDHIQGLGVLARKLGIPIYATEGTWEVLRHNASLGEIPSGLFHRLQANTPVEIEDLEVHPFALSHDAAEPVGYRINCAGKSVAIATDTGIYTEEMLRHLQQVQVLFLEANHDIHMLEAGRYPYYLKRRILGEKGHLSNEDSGRLLAEVLHDGMQHIFLGHLSEENNYPALAYETVGAEITLAECPYRSGDFPIHIAKRHENSEHIIF